MFVRLRLLLKRPVSWGAMVFSYAGIIAAVAYAASVGASADSHLSVEAAVREHDLCGVVVNVNRNAQFRYQTETQNMLSTLDYLYDPKTAHDQLYLRIKDNFPITLQRVTQARQNVAATAVPGTCKPYQKES